MPCSMWRVPNARGRLCDGAPPRRVTPLPAREQAPPRAPPVRQPLRRRHEPKVVGHSRLLPPARTVA